MRLTSLQTPPRQIIANPVSAMCGGGARVRSASHSRHHRREEERCPRRCGDRWSDCCARPQRQHRHPLARSPAAEWMWWWSRSSVKRHNPRGHAVLMQHTAVLWLQSSVLQADGHVNRQTLTGPVLCVRLGSHLKQAHLALSQDLIALLEKPTLNFQKLSNAASFEQLP